MQFPLFAELLRQHCIQFSLGITGTVIFILILRVFSWRTVSQRRHRRFQKKAARALARLPQLRDDAARMVWLRKMNPYVFEEMLLTALSRQGHRIRRNERYSGDGGVDGQVWIHGQRWLIQAKRYGGVINATHVSAFGMLVADERCSGLFVHSGRTGEACREVFMRFPAVRLVSGQRLLMLLCGDHRWMAAVIPSYSCPQTTFAAETFPTTITGK